MLPLPPEVYSAIAAYATPRDLLTLARTTKAFQRAAEPRIYESVVLRDAQSAYHGCHALTQRDGLRAAYVRRFVLYQDARRAGPRNTLVAVPAQFWLAVQRALTLAVNLDTLVLWDPLAAHSWLLDHERIRFRLREASLRLPWDAHLVAFLARQDGLQALTAYDAPLLAPGPDPNSNLSLQSESEPCPLPLGALPALQAFSGPVQAAAALRGCAALARLQIVLDDDAAPRLSAVLGDLARGTHALRSLCVVHVPGRLLDETMRRVQGAVFAPRLRYLGVLPLPSTEPDALNGALMHLRALEALELDVSRWEPPPPEWMLRPLVLGLHVFAPALRQVVFWVGPTRVAWHLPRDRDRDDSNGGGVTGGGIDAGGGTGGEWQSVRHVGRAPGNDNLWRSF